jgi:hypothetical protein
MADTIVRGISDLISVTCGIEANLPSGSTVVHMGEHAGGIIHMEAFTGAATRTLNFHLCPDPRLPNETLLLCDSSNTSIALTVGPSRSYALPDELFASRMFRVTANTAVNARVSFKT